jgi:guanylate kinase
MSKLITITGPSGVGKTTVCNEILKSALFQRVVTTTTRKPREGEIDGIDYHFLTKEEFEEAVKEKKFLEHAEVYGNYYGTPKSSVTKIFSRRENALLVVDIQGFKSIKSLNLKYHESYFIMPPSAKELKKRLENRKTDSKEDIEKRLKKAKSEISERKLFNYVKVNSDSARVASTIRNEILG